MAQCSSESHWEVILLLYSTWKWLPTTCTHAYHSEHTAWLLDAKCLHHLEHIHNALCLTTLHGTDEWTEHSTPAYCITVSSVCVCVCVCEASCILPHSQPFPLSSFWSLALCKNGGRRHFIMWISLVPRPFLAPVFASKLILSMGDPPPPLCRHWHHSRDKWYQASVVAYCKWSNTGQWEGLGTRLGCIYFLYKSSKHVIEPLKHPPDVHWLVQWSALCNVSN